MSFISFFVVLSKQSSVHIQSEKALKSVKQENKTNAASKMTNIDSDASMAMSKDIKSHDKLLIPSETVLLFFEY